MELPKVRVRCAGGKTITLARVLALELTRSMESPAAGLEATLALEDGQEAKSVIEVWVERGGRELFHGFCDQESRQEDGSGRRLLLSARSRGGMLLDNEALPQTCYGISTGEVFRRHLAPYGFQRLEAPREFSAGIFTISKGLSEWEVFCAFCMRMYARTPFITREETVVVAPPSRAPKGTITNDPEREGLRYLSLRETLRRASLVEAVILRDKEGNYSRRIDCPAAPALEIRRKRYVIAAAEYATVPTADGYRRMQQAQRGYRSLRAVLPGWAGLDAGDCVAVQTREVEAAAMSIWQGVWSFSDQGEYTTLTLADPDYL